MGESSDVLNSDLEELSDSSLIDTSASQLSMLFCAAKTRVIRCPVEFWIFVKHNFFTLLFSICTMYAGLTLRFLLWKDMDWDGWSSLVIVYTALMLMIRGYRPDLVLMGAVSGMLTLSIISPEEALKGFSNPGIFVIAVLFIVAEGVNKSHGLEIILKRLLRKPHLLWYAQIRYMLPVTFLSAFLNNTPVVAMLIPILVRWARRIGHAPSKLLMPLSFASILGGTCTLIGTSTNLVVVGLLSQASSETENDEGECSLEDVDLNIFEIALVGVPQAVLGILYMLLLSKCLLFSREDVAMDYTENPREYTVMVQVDKHSPVVDKTIEEAGLRNLEGLFLFEIKRDGEEIPAVSGGVTLKENDYLLFAGQVDKVKDLIAIGGLNPSTDQIGKILRFTGTSDGGRAVLVEAVVSPASPVVNRTVRGCKFRSRYQAAIIAVHRGGQRISLKIGEIRLKTGDTLLLVTNRDFMEKYEGSKDFALLREVDEHVLPLFNTPTNWLRICWVFLLTLTMIAIATSGIADLLTCSMAVVFAMILTRCLTLEEATRSVQVSVVFSIAAAFGIAAGMENSGAARNVADTLIAAFKPAGSIGLLAGFYVVTAVLSGVISNAAAVALMFPIAMETVKDCLLSVKSASYILMLAASSSFATPIGYQTNIMVSGPGGYKFVDFIVFGAPLQLLCFVCSLGLTYLFFEVIGL